MTHYSSSHYDSHLDEHLQVSYVANYQTAPTQALMGNFSYGFHDHGFFQYDPTPYYGVYGSATNQLVVSYYATTFSEPEQLVHNPSPFCRTQFTVSHCAWEFNEIEFEEYDPTPYGGGYDLASVYGKALPPSEETCYPPSSVEPNPSSVDGFSFASIESPYLKEEANGSATKAPNGAKGKEELQSQVSRGEQRSKEEIAERKPMESYEGEDHHTQSGSGGEFPTESGEDHGCGYERIQRQIPSGYGLEAMDLCESLFGHWPCLLRSKRLNDHQQAPGEGSNGDPWKETADYLFGSSYPYSERRDDGVIYWEPIYGYQRHYQENPVCQQTRY